MYLPENHGAVLPVKGKVVYSDGTCAAVDGRRQPVNTAVRINQCIAVVCYFKLSIHTANNNKNDYSTVDTSVQRRFQSGTFHVQI